MTEETRAIIQASVESDRALMTMVVVTGMFMAVLFGVALTWERQLAHDALVNQEVTKWK